MFHSFKAITTLSAVLFTVLAEARNMVPYGSSYIDADCDGATVAVTLLGVCACVNILDIPLLAIDCPDCSNEANALSESVCVGLSIGGSIVSAGAGVCGCECDADSYAVLGLGTSYCYKTSGCSGDKGTITSDSFGFKTCTCNTGYTFSDGECKLSASLNSRKRTRKSIIVNEASDAFRCPDSEAACAIGSGYECIDTTSSLDSCGGCLNSGGVNCLSIPGALGVSCIDSQCILSSCFPGWSLINGKCVEAAQD